MPLTRISVPAHLPADRVSALARAAHDGLVRTCAVPENDLFQLIQRFDQGAMILDPNFGGVHRSSDACIVEITFLQGRTDEQKRLLYRHIVSSAMASGFRSDDIMISLVENTKMDWSLGHGEAYADRAKEHLPIESR